jgi:hypothetical protein
MKNLIRNLLLISFILYAVSITKTCPERNQFGKHFNYLKIFTSNKIVCYYPGENILGGTYIEIHGRNIKPTHPDNYYWVLYRTGPVCRGNITNCEFECNNC